MSAFSKGDLITINFPARGDVGPVGAAGVIVADHGDEVEVESQHTRGHVYFVKREWCRLYTPASERAI